MRVYMDVHRAVVLSLGILLLMGVTDCYMRPSPFPVKSTMFYRYRRIVNDDFRLSCIDGSDVILNRSVVASSEFDLKVESLNVELSNVNAVRYFINLTNGIEAVGTLLKQGIPIEHINYFRLQSTHCEIGNYQGIIENLDYNLLMNLALGYVCVVYDYGSRGTGMEDEREGIPRAFWWGTEWIRYVLDHFWHLEDEGKEVRMVRGYNCRKVFEEQVNMLPKDLKRRIKYFRIYLKTNRIHLYPIYSKTDRDGEREYYAELLLDSVKEESSDLKKLQEMPREKIDNFVQSRIVQQGMHIYRTTDFEGFGRAKGYGKDRASEKGWESRGKRGVGAIGNIEGAFDTEITVDNLEEAAK